MCHSSFQQNLKKYEQTPCTAPLGLTAFIGNIFNHYYFYSVVTIVRVRGPCCALLSTLSCSLLSPFRYHVSWEFLPDDYHASSRGLPVLPAFAVWWPGSTTAGARSRPVTCLPIWGSGRAASTRNVPHFQEGQLCWWKVGSLRADIFYISSITF